jgi:hypothetical protein
MTALEKSPYLFCGTIRDEQGDITRQYQLYGLPTIYFIDKDGVIRSKYIGPFLGPEGLKVLDTRIGMILP